MKTSKVGGAIYSVVAHGMGELRRRVMGLRLAASSVNGISRPGSIGAAAHTIPSEGIILG